MKKMAVLIGILSFILISGILSGTARATWWNESWSRCINITIPADKVNGNNANFPMVLHLDSTRVNYSLIQSAGQDSRIINQPCGFNGSVVPHEIEYWNVSGESPIWFLAQLTASSNLNYSYYYGNPLAVDTQNASVVWGNGFYAVYHMRNDSSTNIPEIFNANGTIQNLSITQTIFDGIDGGVNITNNTGASNYPILATGVPTFSGDNLTVLMWINFWKFNEYSEPIFRYDGINKWGIQMVGSGSFNMIRVCSEIYGGCIDAGGNALSENTWNLVGLTITGNPQERMVGWVNGTVAVDTGDFGIGTIYDSGDLHIGGSDASVYNAQASIGEIEVANIYRSPEWINMTWKSWGDQLIIYGAEQNAPIETTPPNITIYSPQNISYNITNITLDVSADESIDTWWYSLNGGANTTFTPNTTINIANGSNTLLVYANDTLGNTGQASVSFTGNYPTVTTLNSPDNAVIFTSSVPISMTFNCSAINDVNLANITLYLNGVPNETVSVTGIYNFSIFTKTLSLGDYNWTCRACDYADQCSFGVPTRAFSIEAPTPPRPIDNLGLFSGVALLIMGAGILLFILEGLFSSAGELLRNPKAIVTLLIGAIIMAVMILALI